MKFLEFIKETFHDTHNGDKASYGRVFSLPFLAGSWLLSMADGIWSLAQSKSALDAAASLALIGVTLFTGSKALSLRGSSMGMAEPTTPATPAADEGPAAEDDAPKKDDK